MVVHSILSAQESDIFNWKCK